MNAQKIRTLYDYNYWANDRILRVAAESAIIQQELFMSSF
jgi:hypothetical protein